MLEQKAREFASHKHGTIGQVRKYTGLPYIIHPLSVAELVRCVPHTEEMIAAAILHDTVEDTDATLDEIGELFGREVSTLVQELTDTSRPSDGNRQQRKAIDRFRLSRVSSEAQTIKVADLIDNTRDIVSSDKTFAQVYLHEKAQLLEVLTRADKKLWAVAHKQIENAMKTLG